MRFKTVNEEVLYTDEPIVRLSGEDVQFLKDRAGATERKRIRLCAHRDVQDPLHEMIIVLQNETYIRPHRHVDKVESFHIIEGILDVVIFDLEGNITEVVEMGDYSSGRKFFYRLSVPDFHALRIKSDFVVFHETTNGPFDPAKSIYAEWSPDDKNAAASGDFMDRVSRGVDNFLRRRCA